METTITIQRESVFSQVSRRTEWQGSRSPENRDYDRLTLSEADRALFHSFFDEAAMHAIDICRPFLRQVANTDSALSMTINVADGPDSDTLALTTENMLVSHILGLWQEIVSPQRAPASFLRRDEYTLKLQSILYHNPAPQRSMIDGLSPR